MLNAKWKHVSFLGTKNNTRINFKVFILFHQFGSLFYTDSLIVFDSFKDLSLHFTIKNGLLTNRRFFNTLHIFILKTYSSIEFCCNARNLNWILDRNFNFYFPFQRRTNYLQGLFSSSDNAHNKNKKGSRPQIRKAFWIFFWLHSRLFLFWALLAAVRSSHLLFVSRKIFSKHFVVFMRQNVKMIQVWELRISAADIVTSTDTRD